MARVEEGIFQYGEYKFTIKIKKGDFFRQTTATSLARAQAHKARFLAEWREQSLGKITTAHQMFDYFLSEQEERFKIVDANGNRAITENTLRCYRQHIKVFKKWFTTTDTLTLTSTQWHTFFVDLQKFRALKAVTIKKYTETMRYVCKTFSIPFTFKGLGVDDGEERAIFEEEDAIRFVTVAKEMTENGKLPYNILVLFLLAFHCGARKGELIGLHKDDVLPSKELFIHRQLADANGKVYESNTKNKQHHKMELTDDNMYAVLCALRDNGDNANEYLFENNVENNRRKNKFYLPKTVQRYFNKVLVEAELNPKLCFYSIRHRWASILFKVGGPEALLAIQKLGGWTSATPLTKYWQATKGEQKQLLAKASEYNNLLDKIDNADII